MDRFDVALLILRLCFGLSMAWHGANKLRGERGISGTVGWFASIGMRAPEMNARLASTTEIAAGIAFAAGFATPLSAAAIIGVMVVAIVTVHWKVGYFVFLPNQGWEYCFAIAVVAAAVSLLGPGSLSVDETLLSGSWFDGAPWAVGSIALGLVVGLCQLSLFWRPGHDRDRP